MEHEFLSKVSYVVFSEDTTHLKSSIESNFVIFSPIVIKKVNFPYKFKFHLTIGLISPRHEITDIIVNLTNVQNELIQSLALGEMIISKFDLPDEQAFIGSFSVYTDKGLDITDEGILKANVYYKETVLAETKIIFAEVDEDE